MANPTDLAVKHSVATAAAIVSTIGTAWFLETLSAAAVALVFVFFLAVFNGAALWLKSRRQTSDGS